MQIYIFFAILKKSCTFAPDFQGKIIHGKVLEWLKRPAWKASKR